MNSKQLNKAFDAVSPSETQKAKMFAEIMKAKANANSKAEIVSLPNNKNAETNPSETSKTQGAPESKTILFPNVNGDKTEDFVPKKVANGYDDGGFYAAAGDLDDVMPRLAHSVAPPSPAYSVAPPSASNSTPSLSFEPTKSQKKSATFYRKYIIVASLAVVVGVAAILSVGVLDKNSGKIPADNPSLAYGNAKPADNENEQLDNSGNMVPDPPVASMIPSDGVQTNLDITANKSLDEQEDNTKKQIDEYSKVLNHEKYAEFIPEYLPSGVEFQKSEETDAGMVLYYWDEVGRRLVLSILNEPCAKLISVEDAKKEAYAQRSFALACGEYYLSFDYNINGEDVYQMMASIPYLK